METINDTNYELWLVRYADGELTAAERRVVEDWLREHPVAAEELALYRESPRLERNEGVRYVAAPRPLWGKGWRWVAAAAVVLLLVTPLTLQLVRGGDVEPQQVASVPVVQPIAAVDTVRTAPQHVLPESKPDFFKPADAPVETQVPMEVYENYVPSRPLVAEPMLLAEVAPASIPMPVDTAMEVQHAFAEEVISIEEDTLDYLEQRLLALADDTREGLQGTYLGRRMARRLPENQELLSRMEEARERTPRGIRMVTDLVMKLIEVNSKDNNQQNSITL